MIIVLVRKSNLSKLSVVFEAAYCRLATIRKATAKNCQYVRDFDLDMKFNELLRVAQVYNVETTSSIDEESLTYKQAMKESFVAQWKIVDDAKIKVSKDMRIYVRVERSQIPKGTKVLETRMVYKLKKDLNEKILRYKARCVVQDFRQIQDVDFDDIYVVVVKIMSFKTLFAIVVKKDYDCEQMNITIAFLNASLNEKIYIMPSKDYREKEYVWLLKRALYDLKQSSREWYDILKEWLVIQRFQHINANHFVFVKKKRKLIVIAYIDDLLIIDLKDNKEIVKLKKTLEERFKMNDLNSCHHYLNMKITRGKVNKTLHLSQRIYIQKILERFQMIDCKSNITSMFTSIHLVSKERHQVFAEEIRHYQSIVDSLMYVMMKTRLDIAYAVSILSRFETNSNKTHLIVAKHVLRYLKETLHMKIIYEENDVLIDYINVDWADDQKTRRFTRDYLFILYESVVSWSSKRQATVALSSCEVEYMTQTQIAKKIIWLRRLINELNLNETIIISTNVSISINVDN